MKKRFGIALVMALILSLCLSPIALAWGGEDVDVECGPITVTGDTQVGNTVTASGVVTITSEAGAGGGGFFSWYTAGADSTAYYGVTNPAGDTVASGGNSESDSGSGWWFAPAEAGASQTFSWSEDIRLNQAGEWVVTHGGTANAEWASYFLWWQTAHGADTAFREFSRSFAASPIQIGDPFGVYMNRFLIRAGGSICAPYWAEEEAWKCGKTLSDDAVITWNLGDNHYSLFIPKGTVIVGPYGQRATFLEVTIYNGTVTFHPGCLYFSQPVLICELVDGKWTEFMSFNQIVNGKAGWNMSTGGILPTAPAVISD